MKSQPLDLSKALSPIPVYSGVGNPYKTALDAQIKNTEAQNALNNKHGGSTTPNARPKELVVPQAPTSGMTSHGPNDGNTIATQASKTSLDSLVNSHYDSLVQVPQIPASPYENQSGGTTTLLQRLERLMNTKSKANKKNYSKKNSKNKTKRYGKKGKKSLKKQTMKKKKSKRKTLKKK